MTAKEYLMTYGNPFKDSVMGIYEDDIIKLMEGYAVSLFDSYWQYPDDFDDLELIEDNISKTTT